jgi:putative DNA primase/helicase
MPTMTTATKMPDAPPEFNLETMTAGDRELWDDLQEFLFLWPDAENYLVPAQAADTNCGAYWRCDDARFIRGRRIVVARPDTEEGEKAARPVAAECLRRGAESVHIWAVPGYGTESPSMKEWTARNSLFITLGLERTGKWQSFVSFVSTLAAKEPEFSGDPRPIAAELVPVLPLDPAMLPEPFRDWCQDVEVRLWCSLEYLAAPLIVVLSGLIGRRIAIRPKRHDDWMVIPNLWGAIVGPPGSLKTPAIEEVCRPLKKLVAEASERHSRDLSDHQEDSAIAAARRAAARKELDRAAKARADDTKMKELARQLAEGCGDSPPDLRRYFVNDVTNEKLGELMAQPVNANGLIVFRDELVGFFKSMDRPGHEADRSFFLEAWNGSGSFTFDRIGRGTIHIPHACLAIFGGIQPGPLASYLRGSFSGQDCDGFTQRFQVLMYPDHAEEFLNVDAPPNEAAQQRAAAIFRALDALDPVARGCPVDAHSGIAYLRFDEEAQGFFDEWRVALEKRLRSGTLSSLMATHLSKYRSLMPSLALIFHLVDSYDRPALEPVSIRSAMSAAAWCELLEAHAGRIYHATMEGDPDVAIRLSERLTDSFSNPFTHRDVLRKQWSGLTIAEDVRRAVALLEDRNWVKVVEVPPTDRGGRPTEAIWVHPKVRAGKGVKP